MRSQSVSPVSLVGIVVAVGLGVLLAHPGGIRAAVQDLREYGTLQDRLDSNSEFSHLLQVQATAVNNRIQIKDAIIDELILGRATLAEAILRFKVLNHETPSALSILEMRYPNLSEEERAARSVLDFVALREMSYRDRDAVMARLQAEYKQHFDQNHAIVH
ncbi:MAG: hypothetical protein LC104_01795 [Bacteroidales bacterium]|nr:hypothetical protein [Bacteroidales bacterium]